MSDESNNNNGNNSKSNLRRGQKVPVSVGKASTKGPSSSPGLSSVVGGSSGSQNDDSIKTRAVGGGMTGLPRGRTRTPPSPPGEFVVGPAPSSSPHFPSDPPGVVMHKLYDGYYSGPSEEANANLSDATLRTSDGYSFPVHRHLLCAESEYFK